MEVPEGVNIKKDYSQQMGELILEKCGSPEVDLRALKSMKTSNAPAARLANWNVIVKVIEQI